MNTSTLTPSLSVNDRVRISGRYELGVGEVLRVCETGGVFVADVVFENRSGRRLETLPVARLERAASPWQKLREGQFDNSKDFLLRQPAWQFAIGNTGGELSNARTQLLPHQILLTYDVVKMQRRRLLVADEVGLGNSPRFDVIIVDEAHHVSRIRYGKKQQVTMNYRLLEGLRGHTRDLLLLSATPHQGNNFQFWSLINLLDDQLFDSPEALLKHRSLLNRVMIRRTKREVTDARGNPLFVRRQVNSEVFEPAIREQRFYEQLTEYLRTGYEAAGIFRSGRTTSAQRAIGFVMTAFQKMMSSSPPRHQTSPPPTSAGAAGARSDRVGTKASDRFRHKPSGADRPAPR